MRTPFAPIVQIVAPVTPFDEAQQRANVVLHALDWIGTPYRQWGASRHHAIDCAMLLVEVYRDAGLIAHVDPRPYPPEWHVHRGEERYLAWLAPLAAEIETPQAGDIVLFQYGRCFSHAGIMISRDEMVHAYAPLGMCTVSRLSDPDIALIAPDRVRPRKGFDIWAKLRAPETV